VHPFAQRAAESYGALCEGVHVVGYTFERALGKLEWLLADNARWRSVGGGFTDVNAFMASIRLDAFKGPAEQRKKIAERIKALQPRVSNRQIAKTLGVGRSTIDRDTGSNGPRGKKKANENKGTNSAAGSNGPRAGADAEGSGAASATNVAVTLSGATAAQLVARKEHAEAQRQENAELASRPVVVPEGEFSIAVIDPPWPMEKIERDVRPNQVAFDYPTMSEAELLAFGTDVLEGILADDCHLFMWTTAKFLPMALRLIEAWGFTYVFPMTWHKPGGFQPVGLPQYNAEFIIYARRGTPTFVDTKDFKLCNAWLRREHSRKPAEFYDLIKRVTEGSRIDVFSRERHDGFEQYGNESGRFDPRDEPAAFARTDGSS
jgi:N6-adenosine-specific RNA methylase IME4